MLSGNGDHPMTKLSDTQAVILSAASQRDDGAILPLPETLKIKGGAVDKVLGSLKAKGLIDHQGAPRGDDPPPLCITRAGLQAIGVESEDEVPEGATPGHTGATSGDAGAQGTDAAVRRRLDRRALAVTGIVLVAAAAVIALAPFETPVAKTSIAWVVAALLRIAKVDRLPPCFVAVHQAHEPFDQVVDMAKASRLQTVAIDGDVLAGDRLADDVRHHSAVIRPHAWAVRVEDSRNPCVATPASEEIEGERLRRSLAFVVAGARAGTADRSAINLSLRMHLWIAIDFAGRGQQQTRALFLGQAQCIASAEYVGQHRMLGIGLVLRRRGCTGEVEDQCWPQAAWQWVDHVMFDQVEPRITRQIVDVDPAPGQEAVEADDAKAIAN